MPARAASLLAIALAALGTGCARPDADDIAAAFAAALAESRAAGSALPAPPPPPPARPVADWARSAPLPASLPPLGNPDSLLGADAAQVTGRLGPPTLRRRDGPAETWTWQAAGCALDLVFYPADPGPRVGHADLRGAPACRGGTRLAGGAGAPAALR